MIKKFALALALATAALAPVRMNAQTHIDESVAGYRIGRSPSEKFSLWGVPPVAQQSATNELISSLQAVGVISSGTSAVPTPLNLNGGAATVGSVTLGSGTTAVLFLTGTGSPIAGAVVAVPGVHYLVNTGTSSAEYIKLSGTGSSGWGVVTTGTGP